MGKESSRLHAETTNFTVLLIGDELGLKGSDMPYLGLYFVEIILGHEGLYWI